MQDPGAVVLPGNTSVRFEIHARQTRTNMVVVCFCLAAEIRDVFIPRPLSS